MLSCGGKRRRSATTAVETHGDELAKHAALYINSDENGRGYFGAGGSHTLEKFIGQVEDDAIDPETHVSLMTRLKARAVAGGDESARTKQFFPLGALGSGSDFSPFLQHQGVASLNIGFVTAMAEAMTDSSLSLNLLDRPLTWR